MYTGSIEGNFRKWEQDDLDSEDFAERMHDDTLDKIARGDMTFVEDYLFQDDEVTGFIYSEFKTDEVYDALPEIKQQMVRWAEAYEAKGYFAAKESSPIWNDHFQRSLEKWVEFRIENDSL